MSLIVKMVARTKEIEFCAISTDAWTSGANTNYIGFTLHWISEEWKLERTFVAMEGYF
jgi:hypothetical protein